MSNKKQWKNTTPQILIIEDSFACQQIYRSLLEDDYHLELICTANEALQRMSKQSYQCIILDLGLPDKPGVELLPIIHNNSLNKNTPIIVISAHADETLKQRCILLGANEVCVKPIAPTMLRCMIKRFLVSK